MKEWHSPLLYGMHELCPHDVLPAGWLLHLVEVGDSTDPHPGIDVGPCGDYGNIVRLQYSWGGGGTFPKPDKLWYYIGRVKTCVENTPTGHIWIVGNEPNHPQELPADGGTYSPAYVAEVYDNAREVIHGIVGHEQDEVLLPPMAPWIDLIALDWIDWFAAVIGYCFDIDGFALHTYSRGANPSSITAQTFMYPPYATLHNGWQTLYDWLGTIPAEYRDKPVYLTETDQINDPVGWSNINTGWVTAMYDEINRHNQSGGQVVRCALLYRWPHYDDYGIEGNQAIIDDFRTAQTRGYTWTDDTPDPEPPEEDDMIANGSFEGGWHAQDAQGILMLPDGWECEYLEGGDPWHRPEIKPNTEFATDGNYSIRAFPPAHSRGFFGIWQAVNAEAGTWYKFSADVRIESEPSGEMAGFVGIQPWGGGIFERQMIWGKETQVKREWVRVAVIAQAFGGSIRVVMGATNKWATQNNTVWWDNATLESWTCEDGGGEPDPEPPEPGTCNALTEGQVRQIVRTELDRTTWASGTA